jgi:type IV pilus assembly protein PilN
MKTPQINLLPYREEQKKAIKNRYFVFLGLSFATGIAIMATIHSFYNVQITTQEIRNDILTKDIDSLSKQIDEIKKLKNEITAAVARKQVVESLQANRSRAVMLLNQVAQPPANIFYRNVRQTGDSITLNGLAPSNSSVSALLKQIDSSDIIFAPKLVESKAVAIDGVPMIEFTVNAKIIDLTKLTNSKNKPVAKTPPPQLPQPAQPAQQTKDVSVIIQPPIAAAPPTNTQPAKIVDPMKAAADAQNRKDN